MATVSMEKINKVYENGFHAVKDMSLDIADGEFMVLVGPSGCGKTTALRMVAGLEDITSGILRIGGKEANDESPKERDIAMVFQNYALYPHMTVAENIGFALKLRHTAQGPAQGEGQRGGRHPRPDRLAGPQAGAAVRRPAPAGRHGPGHRAGALGVPDGRAAVEPGRQAAGADAGRGGAHPAAHRGLHHLRHARPGRGHDHGRPGHRHAGRHAAAGRYPAAPLRQPGQRLRGRLHRLAGPEPVRRGRRRGRAVGQARLPVGHAARCRRR